MKHVYILFFQTWKVVDINGFTVIQKSLLNKFSDCFVSISPCPLSILEYQYSKWNTFVLRTRAYETTCTVFVSDSEMFNNYIDVIHVSDCIANMYETGVSRTRISSDICWHLNIGILRYTILTYVLSCSFKFFITLHMNVSPK